MTRGRSRNSQRWPSIPRPDGSSPFPRNSAPLDERRRSERSEPFPRLPTRLIRTIGGRKSIGISTTAGPIVSCSRRCIEPWLGSFSLASSQSSEFQGGGGLTLSAPSDWPFPSRFRHQRPLFSCPTPNAPRFTSHMARPTIVGAGPAVDAPRRLWVQHSPLGRNQHATRCYVFRLFPKFAAPCFRRKLMCSIKLRLFLSALGWTATLDITLFSNSSCAVMGHVAYSPRNRLFEPVSGRFTPIRPTNPRRQRNGLPTLATVLSPPAPRPTSGVRLCVDPPPLATACHRPPSSPSTPLPAAEAEALVRCSSGRRWHHFPFPAS